MFAPTPKLVAALTELLGSAPVQLELQRPKPDFTALLLRAASEQRELDSVVQAAVCRAGCKKLRAQFPGASIEVRVPPFAAVQIGFDAGPSHTRGTPPNVVEMTPSTFVDLAVGRIAWGEAKLQVSGVHAAEAARAFPLT